jgi:S1-C subfamily serine protease
MTDQPQPDSADQPTTRYSPPQEGRPPWATTPGWSQRTPEHWFEPMPTSPVQPARTSVAAPLVVVVFVAALLAGAVGSGVTYWALDTTGRLDPPVAPVAEGTPTVVPATPAAPDATATPAAVEESIVARAAEAVSPAIVTITGRAGEATDPFELPETGVGSGIIFDAAGWVLTNRHVVIGATQVTVELRDGRRVTGTVYGEDTLTDLAIVQLDVDERLPVARIGDSAQLRPGDLAVAIGSPLGTFTNSVTSGVISALARSVPVTDPATGERRTLNNLIQTDAAINPGNSGGALVDAAGAVIGVNTAMAAGGAQGIGFAIPINIAKPLLRQAIAGEPLARPWIGIRYRVVDRNVAESEGLPVDYGALIWSDSPTLPAIVPDSPAATAGLEEGDIVTSINGQRIDASRSLEDILSEYQPGDRLTLMLLRNGTTRQVSLTLGTRPAGVR